MCRYVAGVFQETEECIGVNDTVINDLAGRLGKLLLDHKLFLVTAESCTGGGLAEIITRIPGSSNWFERGFVTYSNSAKQELLGVSSGILDQLGAVSKETAVAMAEGALANSHAQISVAITGIAGPDGGSEDKPVGTVCFAWLREGSDPVVTQTVFRGDRAQIRQQACLMAIQGLLDIIESGK
ncbi:MAG: damage-inducible protein CinA [Gammaproteobacteria bacterium RIFCSPLOWO2_12_47_11]|nr:MAG: damage-inducible protein CinA [Gammaproteobacteria bacterium RIFCSPLOWO2_12_47_11]